MICNVDKCNRMSMGGGILTVHCEKGSELAISTKE